MKTKLFYLHPIHPVLDLWDEADCQGYVIRAPDEAIAREQPKRDDSWFTNGGKSPWKDPELTKCVEVCEVDLPIDASTKTPLTPEQATRILYAVPR